MICKKCQIDKQETEFLTGRDDKYLCICKECVDKHFNPDDSNTFMWMLKELDIPYIEKYWKERQESCARYEKPLTLGYYVSYMKLMSFRMWRWDDAASINQLIYNNQAMQGFINTFGEEVVPLEL